MKIKLLLTLDLLAAVALIGRAEQKQALILDCSDSAEIVYWLDTEPKLTFVDGAMTIAIADSSDAVPMENITSWRVAMAEYSSVADVTKAPRIAIAGHTLSVACPVSSEIAVFAVNGTMVAAKTADIAEFDLNSGIYIVKIADKAYKIAIR